MAHFYRLYHGNCALRFGGGIPELKKLDFRGLEGQFDAKKDNFRGQIAKNQQLRPILASRTHLCRIYGLFHKNCSLRYVGNILELKNCISGVPKADSLSKRPILGD